LSIEAMAWAFRQDIPKPGAKLVLLALCDFADESWSCFPGQATLAARTSQGERTVRRHLEWLEEAGYIISRARFSDGRRTSNRYTIRNPRPQAPPSASAASADAKAAPSSDPGSPLAESGANQAAEMADGQSGHRSEPSGEPANLAGESSSNHQENPLPPVDGSQGAGADGCPAHPGSPAPNCRACGTSPRARRAAALAQAARNKVQRDRERDRQWFEEERARRELIAQQQANGLLDGPRRLAREELMRNRRRDPRRP
jgi:hypothetical protein